MLLEYFGMEDINSQPSKHAPPTFTDAQEMEKWVINNVSQTVDDFLLNIWRGTPGTAYGRLDLDRLIVFKLNICINHHLWKAPY